MILLKYNKFYLNNRYLYWIDETTMNCERRNVLLEKVVRRKVNVVYHIGAARTLTKQLFYNYYSQY